MNSTQTVSIQTKKKEKSPQITKQIPSKKKKSLSKNKSTLRKSKRLIKKEKLKKKKSHHLIKTQNNTQSSQKNKKEQNQTSSIKQSLPVKQIRKRLFDQQNISTQKQQYQQQQVHQQKQNQIKEECYQGKYAGEKKMPQHFEHHYISSLTPMASDMRNNFTNIHTHTDRIERNHSEAATYVEYHITCLLLNSQNPVDFYFLSKKIDENEVQIDDGYNIIVGVQLRYIEDSEVYHLRKEVENKNKRKFKADGDEKKSKFGQQKRRKKSFDVTINKVLNSRHVPEFLEVLEDQSNEVIDISPIKKSAFRPVVRKTKKSLSVIEMFYFLWQNKERLSVGRSISHERERPIRLITYLKIEAHSNYDIEDGIKNDFLSKSAVYIPFDFDKDHTQNLPRTIDNSNKELSERNQQNWKIGTIEFNSQIPKRIFQRIKDTEFLRSQFYVNQINIQVRRFNIRSVLQDDISTRHPINFAQLFKYVRKIEVEEATMKRGADIFLKEVKPKFTFSKLLALTIEDLYVLQPLQFIEFQCLESIEFEGKFMYNLRSLKKLTLISPLKRISLNKPLSLLERMTIVQQQPIFKRFHYTSDNLRSLTAVNFDPDISYKNPEDDLIPFELAAKMRLKSVFREEHDKMLTYAEYNKNYLRESQVNNIIDELIEVLNRGRP